MPEGPPSTTDVSMYVVLCRYGRNALLLRDAAMAEHLSYLRSNRHRLRFAGPLLDPNGESATGSLAIVEAATRADAEDYIAREAFCRVGMFDSVEITRFASTTGALQVQLDPDAGQQLFVARWLAKRGHPHDIAHDFSPVDPNTRVIESGPLLSDDGALGLGRLFIVESLDRGFVDRILASDIVRTGADGAGTFVSRWRFGQALSAVEGAETQ